MNAWEEEMGGGLHGDGPSGSGFGMAPRPLCLQPHNLKPPLVYLLTDWQQQKKKPLGSAPFPLPTQGTGKITFFRNTNQQSDITIQPDRPTAPLL